VYVYSVSSFPFLGLGRGGWPTRSRGRRIRGDIVCLDQMYRVGCARHVFSSVAAPRARRIPTDQRVLKFSLVARMDTPSGPRTGIESTAELGKYNLLSINNWHSPPCPEATHNYNAMFLIDLLNNTIGSKTSRVLLGNMKPPSARPGSEHARPRSVIAK